MLRWLGFVATFVALASAASVAAAQGLAGTFDGQIDAGSVQVEFVVSGAVVTGTLTGPGLTFSLEGRLSGQDGFGTVYTAAGTAAFEAYVQGDTLGLYLFEVDAGGAPVPGTVIEMMLTRRSPVSTPAPSAAAQPSTKFKPAAPIAAAPDWSLATGSYATLTQDNALAFLEAFEFVLAQIGYAYQFTDVERQELLSAIAQNFPAADRMDQLVMADARNIWERVATNWPVASETAKREFALGVLILAFGEEAVGAWAGPTGAAGGGRPLGGGNCATFEDCTSSFVDEQTWSDTFNAQGCWAAAGCGGFDAATNSFDYGD